MSNAPWTSEQVISLIEWQTAGVTHPFTCPYEHGFGETNAGHNILMPTKDGWVCPHEVCDYTQNWCHDFMVDAEFHEVLHEQKKMFGIS